MSSSRLIKTLTIGGESVINLVSDNIQLDLYSTGRASFVVVVEQEPQGLVELHIGYAIDNMQPYFLGVIEAKHQSNGRWFLTCRELIGALSFPHNFAIRHATLANVCDALSTIGIEFIYPDASYTHTPVPAFYHQGTGIEALRQCEHVFSIPGFIFQQRPDGKVYVGSWHDSRWPQSEITDFEEHPIKVTGANTGSIVATPKLRPGIKLNNRFITEVTLSENKQVIRWSKTL
ncbi:hypothetical protein H5119_02115 [Pseudoalteromonas sp. SG45-5]|uniref:hypothetical protein n=1 Tax=unclassified Pseudoalteromonas TaxID=194690 RepID=UPI0015F7E125|nr:MULTISPECIES: hypothetical protein [unclassified Pseudoalteromonas]MBB1384355.1 hypothetical protein [Pseudoalteromonas sp. SG45-5]MBB1392357.1 hypothetical protein [Pseudoalteromonas sp. SG44-4]MBB1446832.1 hypothetical protein [Pseudoalteromonas sp. SG41-6]